VENNKLLESISKRLGVLIALQLKAQSQDSVGEGIKLLTRFGLEPSEIAEILNTTANTVSVTRSRMKQKKK
jgi:DNA-binding NarL/FixJ family response regulator